METPETAHMEKQTETIRLLRLLCPEMSAQQ
jgi:hypothetical protein